MLTSYHVHTTWSDGANSPADMVAAARACGIAELGFADHCEAVDADSRRWHKSMTPQDVPGYVAALEACACAGRDVVVRCGLEVEWAPQDVGRIGQLLEQNRLDFVIGSIHYVGPLSLFEVEPEQFRSTQGAAGGLIEEYWRLVRLAADSRLFDVFGHLDYFKVRGRWPEMALPPAAMHALDAIERGGSAVELNVSGWQYRCREAFPSDALLKECNRRGIPVVLSSDAHGTSDIPGGLPDGAKKLRELGYRETCGFRERRRYGIALPLNGT